MPGTFGDMDEEFGNTKAAEKKGGPKIPAGTYKVVCVENPFDEAAAGEDHEVFETKANTKGLKIFFEILSPSEVEEKKTAGEFLDHVFWVTQKNLPYIKRDVETIIGRQPESLEEMTTGIFNGKTCEIVVKHEEYNGYLNARVAFINPWKAEETEKTEESKGESSDGKKEKADVSF